MEITYDVTIEPEHTAPEGNASAIDPETDALIVKEIYERLKRGEQRAWCTLVVTAHAGPFAESAYLGACSFAQSDDLEAFAEDYDMFAEARAFLRSSLQAEIQNGEDAKAWLAVLPHK